MPDQAWMLFTAAATLGFRHGIDWDHLAAISDIVGTNNTPEAASKPVYHSMLLATAYAIGHACVVAILGLAALNCVTLLPSWTDSIMERAVGCTLIFLAAWLAASIYRHLCNGESFHLQSRWMLLFKLTRKARQWLSKKPFPTDAHSHNSKSYDLATVFSIGMIHGIGAETGTQILLIAAIGGAASHGLGLAMLISFILGLIVSNTTVAVLALTSLATAQKSQPLYLVAGALTCLFSFVVGTFLIAGQERLLPDLQLILGAVP